MVIGGALAAVSEAFALARKAGVDPALVRQALLGGFAASRVLEVHGERILNGNYKPGFRANLYAKDLRIAANTLAEFSTPAPVSAAVHQLVEAQVAAGEGEDDSRPWVASSQGLRACEGRRLSTDRSRAPRS